MGELQAAAQALARLRVGERAWFTFDPEEEDFPLRLASLSVGGAQRLRAPHSSTRAVGFVSVGDDEILRFFSTQEATALLPTLARWVRQEFLRHPELTRLCGAEVVQTDARGVVVGRYAQADLWAGVPRRVVTPGSVEAANEALSALSVGEEAWFWLTDAGPGGRALLATAPRGTDPSGRRFARHVRELHRRCSPGACTAQGIARQAVGGLVLAATRASPGWSAVVTALEERAPVLVTARLMERAGAQLRPVGVDLSRASELLEAQEDQTLWFWFDDQELLLETSEDELRTRVKAQGERGTGVRGQLRRSAAGHLELRLRAEVPDLLERLGAWAGQHVRRWPALRSLAYTRMRVRGQDREFVNDAAWAALLVGDEGEE